jgi:conjugal transfer ATP-binding protein TraC
MIGGSGDADARRQVRLQFMLAVVERMLVEPARPELRLHERAVLAQAIERLYTVVSGRAPILSDLIAVLLDIGGAQGEDAPVARALARDLRIWTMGAAGRLLDRPSTIHLTADCAAFDLKGLEGDRNLQEVVMLVISGIIWNLVLRPDIDRKAVVFDEVWKFLGAPTVASFIGELYRTSRKYGCSIVTISQSVEDFTASSIATALVNCSATVYLLRHKKGQEEIGRLFKLNAQEMEVFQNLEMRRGEYSEVLVLHGEHHFLGRVVLSPFEYWVSTTHRDDVALIRRIGQARPDIAPQTVLQLLATNYPRGATS